MQEVNEMGKFDNNAIICENEEKSESARGREREGIMNSTHNVLPV